MQCSAACHMPQHRRSSAACPHTSRLWTCQQTSGWLMLTLMLSGGWHVLQQHLATSALISAALQHVSAGSSYFLAAAMEAVEAPGCQLVCHLVAGLCALCRYTAFCPVWKGFAAGSCFGNKNLATTETVGATLARQPVEDEHANIIQSGCCCMQLQVWRRACCPRAPKGGCVWLD